MAEETTNIVKVKTIKFTDATIELPRRIEIDTNKLNSFSGSRKHIIEQIVKEWSKDYSELVTLKTPTQENDNDEESID